MRSSDYVKLELERYQEMKQRYQKELTGLPKGKLAVHRAKGRAYYNRISGKESLYLGSESNEIVQALKRRRFLETSIKNIENNQALMRSYLQQYRSVNPADVMELLPKTYQTDETFGMADFMDAEKWEAAPYEKSEKRPERLSHRTIKGDLVRSKSEAIIANILYNMKIPYHYEESLWLGHELIAPDFKIAVRSESRFKLLEHCGMMSDPKYRQDFKWKL